VESPDGFMSYYERELRPWEHYIPVKPDMSDLDAAVAFAIQDKNEHAVKTIIQNAQSWCQHKLTQNQLAVDFLWTLASYVDLLNANENWLETWKNDTRAYNLTAMDMQKVVAA